MRIDPADLQPNLLNWMVGGIMAVTFILFWKFVFAKWPVPGLSEAFASI